jgi:hypothetical protein
VCLGADARAANEQRKRDYHHKLEKRERNWMQTLSVSKVEQIQYEQGIDASNLGLAHFYSDLQEKHGDLVDEMFTQSQQDWKEFLATNLGDQRKASGQLGRSTDRISAIDLGAYMKKGHDKVQSLTKAVKAGYKEAGQAAAQTRGQQMNMFTNVMFQKFPEMKPPKPALQNVGAAAFRDALGIATTIAPILIASSLQLKENIVKIGDSVEGHGIYKFNYTGLDTTYIGAIAEEVQKTKPEAVATLPTGHLGVNYNLIDVQFKEVVK